MPSRSTLRLANEGYAGRSHKDDRPAPAWRRRGRGGSAPRWEPVRAHPAAATVLLQRPIGSAIYSGHRAPAQASPRPMRPAAAGDGRKSARPRPWAADQAGDWVGGREAVAGRGLSPVNAPGHRRQRRLKPCELNDAVPATGRVSTGNETVRRTTRPSCLGRRGGLLFS